MWYLGCAILFAVSGVRAGEGYWKLSSDAGVITNNDCGYVSDVRGAPVIRRSFMTASDPGLAAYAADRLNTGDEIEVPADARLEMTTGKNIILVFGAGSKARLLGLRSFTGPENKLITRLDFVVERGVVRCQVRLNEENPEAALIGLNGADVLVARGDVEVFTDAGWRAAALSGSAFARLRRGGVVGAPFVFDSGRAVTGSGEDVLTADDIAGVKARMPFSFEEIRAALPPRPAVSSLLEAP
jgi:hypothetical protein